MSTYSVTRSTVIPAPAKDVFPLVNDFREWPKWSPWEALDPDMQRTYSGAESGTGAKYAWSGNRKAGAGNMEITESREPEVIRIRLEFTKPFPGVNPTTFTFEPEGGGTRVTWSMAGEHKGIGKLFGLFMNLDKMVGRDYEKGLASLASVVASGRA